MRGIAVLCFFGSLSVLSKTSETATPLEKNRARMETHQDLIQKAQNLTLQRDRLQTSQILQRAIPRKPKNGSAYKELVRSLDELTTVFYTDQAHAAYVAGESLITTRPREAIDPLMEALKLEDNNVLVLRTLARAHLILGECGKAENHLKLAENLNAYSAEIKLLRLQVLDCSNQQNLFMERLSGSGGVTLDANQLLSKELGSFEQFARGLLFNELVRKKDFKKARALIAQTENQFPEYPEVYLWKWKLSLLAKAPNREAALRYSQACQNLSPRKKKSYFYDVKLCQSKENVEQALKEIDQQTE
jgi:tetratricopeptide (TPR) repeat protein